MIGPRAALGRGTVIGATAVIGADVQIGRDCAIGPGASIMHALIGDKVIIHPGCRIWQDGFRYHSTPHEHTKVPQIGRVIIEDAVEIGAGTTIDRGGGGDTVIGEGTKIDNLVQIGHNVTIGRHCIIVAQCSLRAELHGKELNVIADGKVAWQGSLGATVLPVGPPGFRTDNARFAFDYFTEIPSGSSTSSSV